jgi:hypothetical protein
MALIGPSRTIREVAMLCMLAGLVHPRRYRGLRSAGVSTCD